jgi:hypothetical protein
MSDNLRMLANYSAAMESGDTEAVFAFWAEDFESHVTERVTPNRSAKMYADPSSNGGSRHGRHSPTCSSS